MFESFLGSIKLVELRREEIADDDVIARLRDDDEDDGEMHTYTRFVE